MEESIKESFQSIDTVNVDIQGVKRQQALLSKRMSRVRRRSRHSAHPKDFLCDDKS
jgi:hypothetical protein